MAEEALDNVLIKQVGESSAEESPTLLLDGPMSLGLDSALENREQGMQAIADSLNQIDASIRAHSDDGLADSGLFLAMLSVFVAGVVGYVSNHLHWKHVARHNKAVTLGESLMRQLDEIESLAIRYWLDGYDCNRRVDHQLVEIRIKANFADVRSRLNELFHLVKKSAAPEWSEAIDERVIELYELITGGLFESTQRVPSKPVAARISSKIVAMKVSIGTVVSGGYH